MPGGSALPRTDSSGPGQDPSAASRNLTGMEPRTPFPDSPAAVAAVLRSARREALFVGLLWVTACAYTVGYAALFAYRADAAASRVLGIPSWVLWGVVLPWLVCTVVTAWYALAGIRDQDLGQDHAAPGEEAGGGEGVPHG